MTPKPEKGKFKAFFEKNSTVTSQTLPSLQAQSKSNSKPPKTQKDIFPFTHLPSLLHRAVLFLIPIL